MGRDAGAPMWFILLSGCSSSSLFSGSDNQDESSYYLDTGADLAADSEDGLFVEPAWWRVHADIYRDEFNFGTNSTIEFWFYDESLQPLCFVRNRLELIQSLTAPFEGAHLWWEVRITPYSSQENPDTGITNDSGDTHSGDNDTGLSDTASSQPNEDTATSPEQPNSEGVSDCPFEPVGLPQQFQLGIGEMHPEIIAAWTDIDWGVGQEPLLDEPNETAAYLSFNDDDNVYVFGTAITASANEDEDWSNYFGDIKIYSAYPFAL